MDSKEEKGKPDFVSHKKVLLFGSESSGKTSLAKRLLEDKFEDNIVPSNES